MILGTLSLPAAAEDSLTRSSPAAATYSVGQQGHKLKWLPYRPSKPSLEHRPDWENRVHRVQYLTSPTTLPPETGNSQPSRPSPFSDPFGDARAPAIAQNDSLRSFPDEPPPTVPPDEIKPPVVAPEALEPPVVTPGEPGLPPDVPGMPSERPGAEVPNALTTPPSTDPPYDPPGGTLSPPATTPDGLPEGMAVPPNDPNSGLDSARDDSDQGFTPFRETADEEKCPTAQGEEFYTPIRKLTIDTTPQIAADGRVLEMPRECPLHGGEYVPRQWGRMAFAWKASGLCHKPLYFEDVHLERYGHSWGPYLQPLISGGHFFLTVPILPYKMGLYPPEECIYTLGYYRPGSCAPYLLDPLPLSVRAALAEAGAWVGGAYLIP